MTIQDKHLEPFYIGAEENFTIYERKRSASGKKYERVVGFYTSLRSAMRKIIRLKLGSDTSIVTLREYLQAYEDLITIMENRVLSKIPIE